MDRIAEVGRQMNRASKQKDTIEMATTIKASIIINKPIDEVFAYVTDVKTWPRWESGLLKAEQTSDGPLNVGTTFRGMNQALGQLNLKSGYIKVMGKGSKERVVPIGKYVQMTLWNYVDKIRPKPFDPDCDKLFLSRDGRPITVNTIKLVFSRLAKRSGVDRLHAHLCRHTFAINYLIAGGDIFSLREILGHTTLEMVNHYLHFTSSQITDQHHKYSPMDKLQRELEEGKKKNLLSSLTP